MKHKIRDKRKTKKRKITRRPGSSKIWFFFVAIFIIGFFAGGGSGYLFGKKTSDFRDPYYSPEVFSLPKGFILGTASQAYHIPIIMYHYVEYNKDPRDTIRMGLTIRRDVFEKQVQELIAAGYVFLTVSDIGQIMDGRRGLPEKAIALTFDDGYRDVYSDVFPILQFYNIKATVFVVSDYLNHSNNLTDEQLKEIVQSGLVEIGGHAINHPALTSLNKEAAMRAISDDKKFLEEKFGLKLTSFAYPYGLFNEEVEKLVKDAGYLQAVSVVTGAEQNESNRFFMFRIRSGNATGESLLKLLEKK